MQGVPSHLRALGSVLLYELWHWVHETLTPMWLILCGEAAIEISSLFDLGLMKEFTLGCFGLFGREMRMSAKRF